MIQSVLMKTALLGIRHKFSAVNHVSTETVDDWIKSDPNSVRLLDCRPPEEFQVSHIPNARRVDFQSSEEQINELLKEEDFKRENVRTVCYCSVGYRSSVFAEKLGKEGLKDVYNMDGSLFKWANEERDIVDSEGAKNKLVHPFNSTWEKLLRPEFRYYSSSL